MQFPDQQGRTAEEAAEYWFNAYWDWMWCRRKDVQLKALLEIFYLLKDKNDLLEQNLKFHINRWEQLKPEIKALAPNGLETSKYLRYPYEEVSRRSPLPPLGGLD